MSDTVPGKGIPGKKLKLMTITNFFNSKCSSANSNNSSRSFSVGGGDCEKEIDSVGENHKAAAEVKGMVAASEQSTKLTFQTSWKSRFGSWLNYDEENETMYCSLCRKYEYSNTMAVGTTNLKTSTISRHVTHRDHQRALLAPDQTKYMKKAVGKALTKEENAILLCFKVVHWLCMEMLPLSKYRSLLSLLNDLKTPEVEILKVTERIDYSSYDTALDFMKAMSDVIERNIIEQVRESPVCTVMTDESTDIVIHHKLVINCRIVNPITLAPKTLFLTDLRITSATGKGIFLAIENYLEERNFKPKQVSGLGTDGARVMTGQKEGLMGHFLRHNPHIKNNACSAHRIALVSEQAANSVPSMKVYQKTVEDLYYHFKKSPAKRDKLEEIQNILADPQIKYREVHTVRWLSFYEAIGAVYRTLDSLLTYLTEKSEKDPVAAGLKKKIGNDFFISMTYKLMDVLQPIMKLSLFFQKKDVDIGNIKPVLDTCVKDLEKIRDGEVDEDLPTFTKQLSQHLVDGTFKGEHLIPTSKYKSESCVKAFVQAMLDNLAARFPEQELMTSFCVLGMKPISLLSTEDLDTWGDSSLQILCSEFGEQKSHMYDGQETTSKPLIDQEECMNEWRIVKNVVLAQNYPRDSTAKLWELIATFHKDMFPNLITLAALALAHPIHTSDCERSFSAQNLITTPLRNRLNADHCDQLMRIKLEGKDMDFVSCLEKWRSVKQRVIFQ